MDTKIKEKCDTVVNNYREAKESLRFDGDYINHFSGVIYGVNKEELPVTKIKHIRKKIKEDTSRMSSFRGDILYIISILIAKEDNIDLFIDNMLSIYEELLDNKFKESQYLVLTAYSIAKYNDSVKVSDIIISMREIFMEMKKRYENVTSEDDYLQIALLVLSGKDATIIRKKVEYIFNRIGSKNKFSLNSVQALSNSLLLDDDEKRIARIEEFIKLSKKKNIKICYQLMPFLGGITGKDDMEKYIDEASEVISYLGSQEYEYAYYMDKSLIILLALAILEINENNKICLEELFAMSVYWFILSKNQGIIEEVLAE